MRSLLPKANRWPFKSQQVLKKGLAFQVISIGTIGSCSYVHCGLAMVYVTIVSVLWLIEQNQLKNGVNLERALSTMYLSFLMPIIPVWHHYFMPIHHQRLAIWYRSGRSHNHQPLESETCVVCGKKHK